MDRENFIELLNRSSPNDIREFLIQKGKRKSICPFVEVKDESNKEESSGKSINKNT